jgi:hypothetical protein
VARKTTCGWKNKLLSGQGNLKSVIGVFALVLLIGGFGWPVHALQISIAKKDKLVFVHRVHPGNRFATRSIHSVELTPIREFFRIDDRYRIVLTGTTFSSTNVGEPYAAFGNEVWGRENGHFRLSNMHRMLPELLIWANRRYENTMQIAGTILPLYGFAGDTLIRIRVGAVPLAEYLYLAVTRRQHLIE